MSLRDCISSALSRGAISADEAKFLLDRSKAYEQLSGSQAKTAFASDLRDEAKERARRETLQADAVSRFYDDQRRFARTTGRADVVKASYAAFENFGSGFQSFRSIRAALMSQALTEMNDFMHAFRRDFAMKRLNRPLMDDLPRAAFGENVSETAKALYQSWLNVAEKLRAQFNAAGGHIGKLENWALPQLHDAAAMLAAGFDRWRDFIAPLLDWDKIKHPVTETKIPEAERESTLRAVYESIVTDGWNRREPSLQRYGKGALYNQRDDARFLHFKDADSWLAYSRAYGRGSPFAAMVDHVNGLTRDIALMKRFGPNPAAMVEYMKQAIDSEAGKLKTGQPSMLNVSRLDSADFAASRAKYMLDGFYDAARGTHVPFSRTGTALGMFRDLQYSAKLGSSVVLHATTNPIIQGLGRHLQGHSIVQMPLELARSFTRNEADEAGLILDDALRHMEAGAREQSAWMKAREATRWLPSFTTHWTGLNAVVEASRRSAMLGQMSTYGRLAGKEFGELPARARDGLSGFGIDADLWDRIRAAKPYDPDSGRPLLRPQDVSDMEARLAYYGLLHGQTEAMVPTSNMHVAAAAAFANRAPIAREVVKSMMMFKSGFLATMMLTQWQQLERELTRNGAGAVGGYLAAMVALMTGGGIVALQLKQMANGKDPLPMDASTEPGAATWGRAMLTSGALGIYGDFINSELSSYGHGMVETLAGPAVTGASDIVHATATAAKRGYAAAKEGLGWHTAVRTPPAAAEAKDIIRAFGNNTPFASTAWFTRAAFNRVILDQLQYMADPDAHRAMRQSEQRIKKATGQGMWWRPGELLPDRPPQFTAPQ